MPGATSASYASSLPITGPLSLPDFNIEGRPRPPSGERMHSAQTFVVLPGFVETMGIQLERGRGFDAGDDENNQIVRMPWYNHRAEAEGPVGAYRLAVVKIDQN